MPWKEQRKMSLKMEFVAKAQRQGARMAALCREYGISRETGYKWLKRYKSEGPDGLEERSRRPKASPLATAEDLILAVLEAREAHPRRGPKKLFVQLERKFGAQTPSVATIARVLTRFGKVRQKSKFRRISVIESPPQLKAEACNDIWTVDFKGWWRARDGQRCEPLTVRDAFSRYILAIVVLKSPSMASVRKTFEKLFKKHGVPRHIQCDNGNPFISVQARGGLTQLSAWWVSSGIRVLRSRPGCPQDNGGHERMHRDMSADLQSYPSGSLLAEQRACDRWRQEFNHVRPHEALKGKVPADFYKKSKTRLRQTSILYPSDWIVRKVNGGGNLRIKSSDYFIGQALVGHRVALQPIDELTCRLWFRDLDLGTIKMSVPDTVIDDALTKFVSRVRRKAA
jgi:putative transposase